MKFIDFGDLVEVTYDNGNQELVSKEEALALGYKEHSRKYIQIPYKNQLYSVSQFGKHTGISESAIRSLYHNGYVIGEQIIARYNPKLKTTHERKITYKNNIYTPADFSKETGIGLSTIAGYYNTCGCNGDLMVEKYTNSKVRKQIRYNNELIEIAHFSKLTNIPVKFIHYRYDHGMIDGEQIIAQYETAIRGKTIIKYKDKMYKITQFVKISNIGITTTAVCNYIKEYPGITGEQIIELYNQRIAVHTIIYNGLNYSIKEFNNLTKIPISAIGNYYRKGIICGEKIIELYKPRTKKSTLLITYMSRSYTLKQFSQQSGLKYDTVRLYYDKGLRTGEEMIERYNKNKQ